MLSPGREEVQDQKLSVPTREAIVNSSSSRTPLPDGPASATPSTAIAGPSIAARSVNGEAWPNVHALVGAESASSAAEGPGDIVVGQNGVPA